MHRARRAILSILSATALASAALGAGSTGAAAYGSLAQWQIALSFNCDNPSFCSPSQGGFWGWAEFDSNNTGDAQLVGCDHLVGGPTDVLATGGAQHFSVNVTGWKIVAPTSTTPTMTGLPDFFVTSEIDTITGRNGGPPITFTIASENMDTGIPAIAGHYSGQNLFGFAPPPGVSFMI